MFFGGHMKILLVEDEPVLALNYKEFLESLKHTVVHVRNAQKAIEVIHPMPMVRTVFDAIITDMQMPGGSGLTLLQTQNERRDTTPCLVHSSENTFRDGNVQLDDLSKIDTVFDFATFHQKDLSHGYIKDFLESLQK